MGELSMPIQTDDSGFEFVLKDEGAIKFLRSREKGEPLEQNYNIIDKDDLYSNEPWKVFGDDYKWHTIKKERGGTTSITYVFTKVKKVSHNSKNISRASGKGTWRIENKFPNRILDCGGTFGIRIMLSFRKNDSPKAPTGWNMHEYSLRREPPPNSPPGTSDLYVTDRVLCKITRRVKDSPPEQSSSTVIGNNNPANKRAAEEEVPPAVQACGSSNKMQKVCVVGSAAEVQPTPTIACAASSNKETPGDDHISSLVAQQNIQQPFSDISEELFNDEFMNELNIDIPEELFNDEFMNELKSFIGNLPDDES